MSKVGFSMELNFWYELTAGRLRDGYDRYTRMARERGDALLGKFKLVPAWD
jgi:hypothetical protein